MFLGRARTRPSQLVTYRWLRRWHMGLNLVLLLVALALAVWVSRRALILVALVPITLTPFSYARLRLHRALTQMLDPRRPAAIPLLVLTGLGALLDSIMIAQLLTARSAMAVPLLHGPGIAWLGPVWFSTHALLCLGYGGIEILRAGGRAMHGALAAGMTLRLGSRESAVSLERRMFLQRLGAAGAGVPLFVSVAGVQLSYDFRVEEREITLPHWPPALDGLRVAHLSDIHVGGTMNRDRLLHVTELTNASRPDLVVHTGDFLTHRGVDFDAPLYEALGQVTAPYGQWACLGNHDFDDPERLVRKLRAAGVNVLRNTIVTVSVKGQPLEVAGIDFLFRGSPRAAEYPRIVGAWGPRPAVPRVLLTHDPGAFAALPDACADLVLSGHTHGGHIGIQLGPSHALTVVGLAGIPDQGVFQRGDMRMFVTRCVGFYGYPMRVGIPPEIALLTLRAPSAGA